VVEVSQMPESAAMPLHPITGDKDWFDKPMRWAQLTLAENDPAPGQYSLDFWLDYFKRIKADAACLSAAGCVCYYPTKVLYHYRSPWIGDDDPFGDLVEGCRKLGMVIIGRSDPHAVHQDAADAHPEWLAIDAQGNPRRHWSQTDLWVTCALGPYNFEQMTEIHREIMKLYMLDGLFSNRWSGHGVCYCESCQRLFKAASGHDLPRTRDPQDPAAKAYIMWRQERLFDLWQLWDKEIRAINPRARMIPNTGGGALSMLDMKRTGELSDILFADRQARRGVGPVWLNGKNGKEFRAALGNKPIGGIFSVGVEEQYRWKDSVQSGDEIRMWVADGVANDLRLWFTKFCGMIYDPRWLDVIEGLYKRYAAWEPYLRNVAPVARVGLVYSQQTAWFYGSEKAREKVEDHELGFYHALIGARIPFEMVHDRIMDADHLRPFKTLILPNIACLSDAQCQQVRQFVQGGGSIVATYETSLYDEWGVRRPDFGLADLFGARYTGGPEGPMQNSYLTIERDKKTGAYHPLLAGLEDAGRIINGVSRVIVEPTGPYADPPLTLVPSYPDLPMEAVWPRVPHTDTPEVYVWQIGKGRVVYFPWDVDRAYWEILCVDHGKLLANAVSWATNEEPPVTVTGQGVLDVTMWRQASSLTVHLVNLTNPMMMKGPIHELYAVGAQTVRVRLPDGARVKRVHLLNLGVAPRIVEQRDGFITVIVPSVLDHEVVAIDLV
jgi:hypothetical protein